MVNVMYNGFGKYAAQNRYDEWNTTQVKLKFNNKTDQDILKWIQSKRCCPGASVQGAIKELIRNDIRSQST